MRYRGDRLGRGTIRCGVAAMLVVLSAPCLYGQSVVYVVRHAEKESNSGDTPLSAAGFARAEQLAKVLQHAHVKAIYTSDALRTKQTAAPLASAMQIVPKEIPGGVVEATFADIKTNHPHDAVLIVGHAPTVGMLVKKWATDANIQLGDEYHNLFIVVPDNATTGWVRLTYGAGSP